jgi:hypothetical protein
MIHFILESCILLRAATELGPELKIAILVINNCWVRDSSGTTLVMSLMLLYM